MASNSTGFVNLGNVFKAGQISTLISNSFSLDIRESNNIAFSELLTRGFDQAPILEGKKVVGWVTRKRLESGSSIRSTMSHLRDSRFISDESSIDDALRHLADVGFVFTVNNNGIQGFICASDLERHIVRTHLFMLYSQVEIALGQLIKRHVPEKRVVKFISNTESSFDGKSLREKYEIAKAHDSETHAVEYLFIGHMIEVASMSPRIQQLTIWNAAFENKLKRISARRNDIAHPVRRFSKNNLAELMYKFSKDCYEASEKIHSKLG